MLGDDSRPVRRDLVHARRAKARQATTLQSDIKHAQAQLTQAHAKNTKVAAHRAQ